MLELIMGGLGAIMDICMTITSSLDELVNKNKKISNKSLIASGKIIGKDIVGTMINVLFFTYICGLLPNFIIFYRNGININMMITEFISLEMCRALVGSIGIVLSIIISIYTFIYVYKRGDIYD